MYTDCNTTEIKIPTVIERPCHCIGTCAIKYGVTEDHRKGLLKLACGHLHPEWGKSGNTKRCSPKENKTRMLDNKDNSDWKDAVGGAGNGMWPQGRSHQAQVLQPNGLDTLSLKCGSTLKQQGPIWNLRFSLSRHTTLFIWLETSSQNS